MVNESDNATTARERGSAFQTMNEPGVPLFMNVTLTIKAERREEFLAALREVLPRARAEESCVYLHVGESAAEPGVFVLSEAWKDLAEYRDVILRKPYFRKYLEISESAYARSRTVVPLSPVEAR